MGMHFAPLSIIHVLRAPVGGLFRHVVDLAREQAARGCMVGIIADSSTGGDHADAVFRDLAPYLTLGVHRLAMPRLPGPGDVTNALIIGRKLAAIAPDVVHGHGSKGGLYARAPGLLGRGGPVRAYTPHGGSFHYSGGAAGSLYMGMERLLARATDLFLFESAYIRDRFERAVDAPAERKRVTLNGVSEGEFTPVPPREDAADFLYIGELRALKGVDTLLDALAALPDGSRATLNLVGAGADEQKLRARADAPDLQGRVRFLGAMPAREAFATARTLVVPSRAESLPYVVIEAAAAHMPIVATRVGGIPEILEPIADELLPPDDPASLGRAMTRMHAMSHDARKKRARALAAFVRERFTVPAMADAIPDACREAVFTKRAAYPRYRKKALR